LEAILPKWEEEGGWYKKCEICWYHYMQGIQHPNSLRCWKLGIPYSAIKDLKAAIILIKNIIKEIPNSTYKYMKFQGLLKPFTKGIIILYFEKKEDMDLFIKRFKEEAKDLVKDAGFLEKIFYKFAVNTDEIENKFYFRRGCPEYDFKFGSWRKWEKYKK